MARRKRHYDPVNHDRWLISYADFITLLFAFFVVMYAVSSVNEGKYRVLSDSIVNAFGFSESSGLTPVELGNPMSTPIGTQGRASQGTADTSMQTIIRPIPVLPNKDSSDQNLAKMQSMTDEILKGLAELSANQLISVERHRGWLAVEINSEVLFASGSASMIGKAESALSKVADTLKDKKMFIEVEGFTDNLPIQTLAYPSNWELSAARAASVVHLFTEHGVNPAHMAAIGYGEYRPKAENTTPAGRQKNRRVVLIITSNPRSNRPAASPVLFGQ